MNKNKHMWGNYKVTDPLSCIDLIQFRAGMHTSEGATGRPGGDGVASLVEKDIGPSGTHFLLWHQVYTAVIIAIPQAIH